MDKEEMFRDISIMGRVVYIILAIDAYLEGTEEPERWNRLLEALWSYPEFDRRIDDYAYKVIECSPECVLDERADFETFDYFSKEELMELKNLYSTSAYTETVDYLIGQINEILAYNLYTSVEPPEPFSLKTICETHRYIEGLLGENTPAAEPLRVFSIYESECWGNYALGREEIFRLNG